LTLGVESNEGEKMPTISKARGVKAIAALALGSALLAAAAPVNAQPFSFDHVEYMPRDQRVPAAKAFVAEKLPPGTPIASALETLRKANATCRTPSASSEPITCTHRSFERHPNGADMVDVSWIVKVTPTAAGTVASATVRRSTNGY
jgi:hypothetical protein